MNLNIIIVIFINFLALMNITQAILESILHSKFQIYILQAFNLNGFFQYLTGPIILGICGIVIILTIISGVIIKKQWGINALIFTIILQGIIAMSTGINPLYDIPHALYTKFFKEDKTIYAISKTDLQTTNLNSQNESFNEIKNYKKVIIIIMESMSYDFIYSGNMPQFEKIIKENQEVANFYPSGAFTLQGATDILCGHINTNYPTQKKGYKCIPEIFADNEYKTIFLRGASKYSTNEDQFWIKYGYQKNYGSEDLEKKYSKKNIEKFNFFGFNDHTVFEEGIKILDENKENKLFLTLLTVDLHYPGTRNGCNPNDKSINSNLKCIDQALGNFINELKTKDYFEDTIVYISADHLFPVTNGKLKESDFKTKPANTPFVIITKDKIKNLAATGSQIDIAPTILNLNGFDIPKYYSGKILKTGNNIIPMGYYEPNIYAINSKTGFETFREDNPTSILQKWIVNKFHTYE